jgi:hypothetical protein
VFVCHVCLTIGKQLLVELIQLFEDLRLVELNIDSRHDEAREDEKSLTKRYRKSLLLNLRARRG